MLDYVRLFTRPTVPQDIAIDLQQAVYAIVGHGVPVDEIRLFGSLDNGAWVRATSDIDLAVFLGTDNKRYSMHARDVVGSRSIWHWDGCFEVDVTQEAHERVAIRKSVSDNDKLMFADKYTLHIMNRVDLTELKKDAEQESTPLHDKNFLHSVLHGRLLYRGF